MRTALSAVVVSAAVLVVASNVHGATVWDPVKDFTIERNPNGVWSYGFVAGGEFHKYTDSGTNGYGRYWLGRIAGDGNPSIFSNDNGPPVANVGVGQMSLHPGPGGEMSLVRWTAPSDITPMVAIQGRFYPGDGGVMQVGVFKDGNWTAPLWHATDSGVFDFTVQISAGQTIEFGVYGAFYSGNTPLEATITSVVPEPSALARWVSLAAVGAVVAWRWRRRKAA